MNESTETLQADICVIGSGFGGSMLAKRLLEAGRSVVMLERGNWVQRGPHNWAPDGTVDKTEYYSKASAYRVAVGGNEPMMGAYNCVGGPSVFYGAVSLRFREQDFEQNPQICKESSANWPFRYKDIEAYYTEVETILDIAGERGTDPTDPEASGPYPQRPAPLSQISSLLARAGAELGRQPFQLPLAINYRAGYRQCQLCSTCDTYACAVSAKNDLATVVLPQLKYSGMTLRHGAVVRRLVRKGERIVSAEFVDRDSKAIGVVKAKHFVLSAGALGTPHLLLASGLSALNPAGELVGQYLMRHINAIIFGLFPRVPAPLDRFHKQLGFHDFYFGHPEHPELNKLGGLQQIHSPPIELIKMHVGAMGALLGPVARRMTGLLAMAEDQPQQQNGVRLNRTTTDFFGLPQLVIRHDYTSRDLRVLNILAKEAKRILRCAGARLFYTHHIRTFSHACGTVRMGRDPKQNPADEFGGFRGLQNLTISDASLFPTSAAVNPSLTISANALRIGDYLIEKGVV